MAIAKYPFLSSYPTVFGIVFALKSDSIPDKRIALALHEKNHWKALRIALEPSAKKHRYVALFLYYLYQRFHWVPPLRVTLWACRLIGPASAWFKYLQESWKRPSLLTATNIYTEQFGKSKGAQEVVLDLGSGIGQLSQQFPRRANRQWICADKNFFSLFLAQLYNKRADITYVCADIEVQQLFPNNFFTSAVCIDCFDFIYQKDVFLWYVSNILKKNGTFVMMNIHEEQPGTERWGYGISHTELKKMLRNNYRKVAWHDLNFPADSERKSFAQLDSMRYSFVATK